MLEVFKNNIIYPLLDIDMPKSKSDNSFMFGYPPMIRFRHNYERYEFIKKRHQYVVAIPNNDFDRMVIILKERDNHVTIYRDAVNYIYKDKQALKDLITACRQFYTVEVQDLCRETKVEIDGSSYYVHEI